MRQLAGPLARLARAGCQLQQLLPRLCCAPQAAALGQHLCVAHPALHSPVFCSAAVRARDTAAIMLEQWPQQVGERMRDRDTMASRQPQPGVGLRARAVLQARPPIVESEQLLELSQGTWEGQPRAQCYTVRAPACMHAQLQLARGEPVQNRSAQHSCLCCDECMQPETRAAIRANPWQFAAPGGESQRQLESRVAAVINERVLPALAYGGPPALVVSHRLAIKWCARAVAACMHRLMQLHAAYQ